MLLRCLLAFFLTCSSALAKETLTIALDADLSAVAVEGGTAIKRGALIAIDEINAQGGILGHPLELKTFDHRGNPARGIANIKKIATMANVIAVLGGVHTPVALQELPHIHENQLLYLDPWAAGTPVVDNGYSPNFVFRVSVRDQEAGKVLVAGAKKSGAQNIALLLERTGWGRSNEKSMTTAATEQGMTVTSVQWFNWKQKEMKAEIEAIAKSGAEAVLLVANAPEGALAIKTLEAHSSTEALPVFSHWGVAGGAFIDMLGLEVLAKTDLHVLQTYSFAKPSNPRLNKQVLRSYQRLFDSKVSAEAMPGAVGVAHAYDLIHLLKLAAEFAESVNPGKIRAALEQISDYKGLVKHYKPPFSAEQHDALWAEDYFLSRYNEQGHLVPAN